MRDIAHSRCLGTGRIAHHHAQPPTQPRTTSAGCPRRPQDGVLMGAESVALLASIGAHTLLDGYAD